MGPADRIHRVTSADGTDLAGRVHGEGPPLLLVHGSLEDGDLVWSALLPHLRDRFTCYAMSTRCRGLSGASDDLSPERLVEDVTAFAESVGEAVGLVGESAGGMLALGAAARCEAVSAVAVYEPTVFEVFGEEHQALLGRTLALVGDLVARGRAAEAARAFAEPLVSDEELAAVASSGYFEECAPYVPVLLGEISQAAEAEGESPTDPSVLARITAPVLALRGSQTALRDWFAAGVEHVREHAPDVRVREVAGAGHWGPALHADSIARELVRFFDEELQPA